MFSKVFSEVQLSEALKKQKVGQNAPTTNKKRNIEDPNAVKTVQLSEHNKDLATWKVKVSLIMILSSRFIIVKVKRNVLCDSFFGSKCPGLVLRSWRIRKDRTCNITKVC